MHRKLQILIVGHFGRKNIGDDAMLLGILRELYERLPDVQVRVLSTSQNPDFSYNLPIEWNVGYSSRSLLSILRSLIWSNFVILGGGTHFHDFHGHRRYAKNFAFFGAFFTLTKLFRKKIVFMGVGVGPLDTGWGKWFARRILLLANLIMVREHHSSQLAKKLTPKKKILVGFDPAVLLTDLRNNTYSRTPKSIKVLGCSILPYYAIYENKPQRDGILVQRLAKVIKFWLAESKDREVHIIVFHGLSKEDDFNISHKLANEINEREIVGANDRRGVAFVTASVEGENAKIAYWFLSRIWPRVLEQQPEAHLHLLGKGAQKLVAEVVRSNPQICDSLIIEGFQDNLSAFYLKRDMAVCPVFKGYGLITKAVEALQHGCITVGSPEAFNGISGFRAGKHGFVARTDEEFVEAIAENLERGDMGMRLAAHRLIRSNFNWARSARQVIELIERLRCNNHRGQHR